MPQLLDPHWKPSTAGISIDGTTPDAGILLLLRSTLIAHLIYPKIDPAQDIQRRRAQASLAIQVLKNDQSRTPLGVQREGSNPGDQLRNLARQYQLAPSRDPEILDEADSPQKYLELFDQNALPIKFVGRTMNILWSGHKHHDTELRGGISLGKSRDISGAEFGLNKNKCNEFWRDLQPVAHICGAVYYQSQSRNLWDDRNRWVDGWVDTTEILELLASAAQFENFGTGFQPVRSRETVLHKQNLWSVDSIVPDLDDEIVLAPLDQKTLLKLKARRAHEKLTVTGHKLV